MDGQQFPSYIYLNATEDDTYLGFIDGPTFFLVLKSAGLSGEQGDSVIELLRHTLAHSGSITAAQFETLIADILRQQNVPVMTSVAAGKIEGNTLLLKTIGEGQIYIQRHGKVAKLLQGNNVASGPTTLNDIFLFTTSSFLQLFENTTHLMQFMKTHQLEHIVDALQDEFGNKDDHGNVALFIQNIPTTAAPLHATPNAIPVQPKVSFSPSNFIQNLRYQGINKKWTLVLVLVLAGILLWSVVFGYQRRTEQERTKVIETTTQSVTLLLDSAKSIAGTDLNEAKEKIAEADSLVVQLEEKVGESRKSEVASIRTSIRETENSILQRDSKAATEFYDLTLEDKEGRGDTMVLADEDLYILNKEKEVVYRLSIPQKSIEVIKNTRFGASSVFDIYNEVIYLVADGVYTIEQNGQGKKIIQNDLEWRNIKDIKVYGGNVYLLDTENNDLYKYSVIENGFGDRTSYLSGYTLNLSETNSLAIDGSIYIDTPDKVYKFTAGAQQDFATDYLETSSSITKVIAVADTEEAYVWDKGKGVLYVVDKEGKYKKSITAGTLREASDVIVFENKIYTLQKNKIFTIEVN